MPERAMFSRVAATKTTMRTGTSPWTVHQASHGRYRSKCGRWSRMTSRMTLHRPPSREMSGSMHLRCSHRRHMRHLKKRASLDRRASRPVTGKQWQILMRKPTKSYSIRSESSLECDLSSKESLCWQNGLSLTHRGRWKSNADRT